MSVGLLVVQLHYGLHVFCHLSILLNAFQLNIYLSVCLKYGLHGLLITSFTRNSRLFCFAKPAHPRAIFEMIPIQEFRV